jgi:hypothetical protein
MVSGHLIIKPTIALQRLNLQDVQSVSPVEEMQSALRESVEGIVFYCCVYIHTD